MKKAVFLLIFAVLFSSVIYAEEYKEVRKFKDMSDQHWAAGAVYNLVKMGVVSGFPDGTFRGKQNISRYEVAAFLSKLSDVMGGSKLKNLSEDVDSLKTQVASIKKSSQLPVSGSIETTLRYGNLFFNDVGGHGPVANYRAMASIMNDLGEGTSVKFNIDTMDAGFYGGSGDIATRFFDIEGKMVLDPKNIGLSDVGFKDQMSFTLTYGPGARQHTDSTGVLPGEEGIVYSRPYTGLLAEAKLLGLDVKGGYSVVNQSTTGKINTNRLTGGVAYTFPKAVIVDNLKLAATGDYYVASPVATGPKDLRGNIDLSVPLSSKVKLDTHFGFAHTKTSGLMVGAKLDVDDLWNTGTKLSLSGSKIGSKYINLPSQFDYAGLDFFSRPLENATVNIGGELVQALTPQWALKGKGDLRLSSKAKSRATAQVGLAYDIAPQTVFDAFYRVNQDPAASQTSDITAMGLLYRF